MRYYYTEPLAAAWMNIKFGIRYSIYSPLDGIHREPEKWDWSWEMLAKHQLHYRVIPDSLHLLRPQVGDLIEGIRIGHVQEVSGKELSVDVHGGDWEMDADSVTIIQRNGIPFMWPETETE